MFPRSRDKQIDELLQIGPSFRTRAVSRVPSAVLSASPDHVQIRFGPHDIPQRTSYLGSAVSDQFGFGRREHSRKHSRHYGSVKPRAADRSASASGFPERRISRNPRVHPVVIRLTASRSATVGMELWESISLCLSLHLSLSHCLVGRKRDIRNLDATQRTGEINRTQTSVLILCPTSRCRLVSN